MDADRQFTCQECNQPIVIDQSLAELGPSALDVLQNSLPPSKKGKEKNRPLPSAQELLNRVPAPPAIKEAWLKAQANRPKPEQSYVLLQDSVLKDFPSSLSPPTQKFTTSGDSKHKAAVSEDKKSTNLSKQALLSDQINSHAKLFDLVSSRTDIDHPLCEECGLLLLATLTKKLEETKRERDGYLAFEKEIIKEQERERSGPSEQELDAEIEKLQLEEDEAIAEIRALEAERLAVEQEIEEVEKEGRRLTQEEDEFFANHNDLLIKTAHMDATLASLQTSIQQSQVLLAKLEKTNVYADAFTIGVEGAFGTINGLRFGRSGGTTVSPSSTAAIGPVEWTEVNAAWGLVVLCLKTIARKVECEFESYTLNPLASTSSITHHPSSKNKGEVYELYFSTDVHIGRLLHNRRFDTGMVMFLDCLRIVMSHVQGLDPSLEFPFLIQKDRIGEASIKLQFSQEDNWTRALRNTLLLLKILLRWMTNGN